MTFRYMTGNQKRKITEMAENPETPNTDPAPEIKKEEPEKLPENPPSAPAEKPTVGQTVKVDLGELRELLEGLPEKTAQFIKEAVSTPKKKPAETPSEKKTENAPEQSQNNPPKQSGDSKRGWLAHALFGK